MTTIEIEFIFDFVCAWCYIAKRNLDSAISLYQKTYPGGKYDTFAITWTPYYLNYNPHPHRVDKLELAESRLADMTSDQRIALNQRMTRAGLSSGINFKWGGYLGPGLATRNAHRLVHLAGAAEDRYNRVTQGNLVEAILDAYNCREQDIARDDVLVEAALRAGVRNADAEAWLQSDEAGDVVDAKAEKSKVTAAQSGVPTLIIQGKHRPEGIPDVMDLMQTFIQIKEAQ
ncbi:uncharacterized protein CTRU02_204365 [Colletotrichum truncatum]|uniref:Uncharacterized protein n=1 Tax=Colletotrichum truncatum TaxID=5467 RepID=A0ACC3ZCG8_COLTU|nr:uncharacterized protein CTRU02_13085 [Colletotrichum truncatum]KAF6783835.1 hypothetical protein CTRU02_13085 [Colletotrichum truncatum]